jgi:hypothetical protein
MARPITIKRRIARIHAAASSQWRNPSMRHSSDVESAGQGAAAANAPTGTSIKLARSTTYLHIAMWFEKKPCTFDLCLRRL